MDYLTANNITSVNHSNDNLPEEYELYQNYPNPFNPSTFIKYTVIKETNVILKAYNIPGSE